MFTSLGSLEKRIISAAIIAPIFLFCIISGDWPLTIWLTIALIISTYEWVCLSKKTPFFIPCLILGIVYMFLSYSSFYILRDMYSINVLLVFIGMIWASDTGAYFTGKTIGGPKLIKEISPNKTWSGFGGALLFPALLGIIWYLVFGFHMEFDGRSVYTNLVVLAVLGVVTGAAGQAGDLLVSFVKRQAGVKDTGNLIPGHGGLLDRIDSLLLATPVFFLAMVILSYVL